MYGTPFVGVRVHNSMKAPHVEVSWRSKDERSIKDMHPAVCASGALATTPERCTDRSPTIRWQNTTANKLDHSVAPAAEEGPERVAHLGAYCKMMKEPKQSTGIEAAGSRCGAADMNT